MYASIVVLSALVAVTAGQYVFPSAYSPYGIPVHSPITGQPLDTPEVAIAKARHANQWNLEAARSSHVVAPIVAAPVYLRKRREAPTVETPETQNPETAETPKEKRAIVMPFAYSPLAYSAYSPLAYSGLSTYYPYAAAPATYLLRKRREVSAEEAPETTENNKEKRQTLLPLASYGQWTSPLAYSAYPYSRLSAISWNSGYPYSSPALIALRKRRDTGAASEEQATPEQSENKEKRQVYLTSPIYHTPAVIPYSSIHAPVYRAPLAYSYFG